LPQLPTCDLTLKGNLNECLKMKVQQNGIILWVKSHKLDLKPLGEDLGPIQTNLKWHLHGIILKGNSIGPYQKMKLKGKLMVGKQKYKLGFNVVFFIVFCCFSFVFEVQIYARMEDILWIENIVENTPTIYILSTCNVDMVGFVDSPKVVAWRNTF